MPGDNIMECDMPNRVEPKSIYKDGKILTDTLGPDKTYDQLVFIGRFQPLHYGHMRVIDIALRRSKKVIILAGSANVARTLRNPFTFHERYAMIASQYQDAIDTGRLHIEPLDDYTYQDEQWLLAVQKIVGTYSNDGDNTGLIGCQKDHTSYYLGLFPQWHNIGVEFKVPLNSTDVREAVFLQDRWWNDRGTTKETQHLTNEFYEFIDQACPIEISRMLHSHINTPEARETRAEWKYIKDYKEKRNAGQKFPIIEQTVDACVIQSGHVLVVVRKNRPGKNALALPGGFLDEKEKTIDGILRELDEETSIDVSKTVLRANMLRTHRFDDPNRSDRGRIITECGLFKLQDRPQLPNVKGKDDAKKAFWLPLNKVNPVDFFEDHAFIIRKLAAEI